MPSPPESSETPAQSKDVAELFRMVEEKGISFEEKRVEDLSREAKMPYINLQRQVIEQEALTLIPKHIAQTGQIICFHVNKEKNLLRLAVMKPNNPKAQETIDKLKEDYSLITYLMSEASFEHAISLYPLIIYPAKKRRQEEKIVIKKSTLKHATKEIESWPGLGGSIINKRVDDMVATLIGKAIKDRASDIHLEPKEKDILLRLRIDGIMHDIINFSPKIYPRLLSRLKLLGGLMLNITQTPQDGRFTVYRDGDDIDLRISVVPTHYGEATNLRLLGLEQDQLSDIHNLGIEKKELKTVKINLAKPDGMVLLTGATGSGKTTTLYAFLNHLKNPDIKIIALEDPIEYRLDGISQTQINEKKGLTFAKALRGVLRQDPDVIMVGEIRDPETAAITIRAATTGHIVFSTLHAGSTAEIITQLENMGADSQNLSDVLNLLINQRLVRRLCPACRKPYKANMDFTEKFRSIVQNKFPIPEDLTLYRAKGCKKCNDIGYKGRIGIFEMMSISKKIRELISNRASPTEIHQQALIEGMILLIQDGIYKVIKGITTLEELKRVI